MIQLFNILLGKNSYSELPEDETAIVWLGVIFGFIAGMIFFYNVSELIKSI